MHNRYFEIELSDPNINDIYAICVESAETIQPSLDGSKTIVKLCCGDDTIYEVLTSYTELTKEQAVTLANSTAYIQPLEQ